MKTTDNSNPGTINLAATAKPTSGAPSAEAHGYTSGLSVAVAQHPNGCIVRIEHEGATMYLDRSEAFDLYEQLRGKLGQIPVKL